MLGARRALTTSEVKYTLGSSLSTTVVVAAIVASVSVCVHAATVGAKPHYPKPSIHDQSRHEHSVL